MERFPTTSVAQVLRQDYALALIARGSIEQSVRAIDVRDTWQKASNPKQAAEAILHLTTAVSTLRPSVQSRVHDEAESVSTAPTPLSLCLPIAQGYHDAGDYIRATEVLFAVLRTVNALAPNLVSGAPLRRPDEIVDSSDPEHAKLLAKYFLAIAQYHSESVEAGRAALYVLATAPLPKRLQPYVLLPLIEYLVSQGNFESAQIHLDNALAELPNSSVLVKLRDDMTTARQHRDTLQRQ